MNAAQETQLTGMFAMYAAYYRQALPDEVLKMYASDLADLSFDEVRGALEDYRRNPKNRVMPLPALIRETLEPSTDPDSAAREIAARIASAIPKYGYPNREAAKNYIGEVGWNIVEKQGGWDYVSRNMGVLIDAGQFQAQVRELAKSSLTQNPEAIANMIGLAPGVKVGEMQSLAEIMKLLPAPRLI